MNEAACSSRQLNLFDEATLNSLCGKTSRTSSIAAQIFKPPSKPSRRPKFQYLNAVSQTPVWLTSDADSLPTEFSTLNFSESRNVVEECFLSQILQDDAPPKYFLSIRACQGILRRARLKNKTLPPELERILISQSTTQLTPTS